MYFNSSLLCFSLDDIARDESGNFIYIISYIYEAHISESLARPVDRIVWEGLISMALLEHVCHGHGMSGLKRLTPFPISFPVCECVCLCLVDQDVDSHLSLPPCLCSAILASNPLKL